MLDIGLLCAKSNIEMSTFYLPNNRIFSDFQGALAEQFVIQELKQSYQNFIYYWGREKGEAEVDFVVQYKNEVIPIEVKSAWNTQSKSLKTYIDIEKPEHAVKLSLNHYDKQKNLYSVPLYMISMFTELL
jgi:predicted AAA+ superfamily ATPase